MNAPAPMSAERLRVLLAEALHRINLAVADADGNQDRAPYNLVTPGGSVNDELLVVYEGLAWVIEALSPSASASASAAPARPAP